MAASGFRLVWSADADGDLLQIWRYGAEEWSLDVADAHERTL
jgi:hypothetical protein